METATVMEVEADDPRSNTAARRNRTCTGTTVNQQRAGVQVLMQHTDTANRILAIPDTLPGMEGQQHM